MLLIPYDEGALLISDRLSAKYDGTTEAWDKIYIVHSEAVIGLSGGSEETRFLAQVLPTINEALPERYASAYGRLRALGLPSSGSDIEALCITRENGALRFYKFTRSLWNEIQTKKSIGIGIGEHVIRPQLTNIVTIDLSREAAMEFGKILIQYASLVEGSVGHPSEFGFSLATVPAEGPLSVETLPSQTVSIERLLYRL